jgi:hypothetical protein
MFSIEHITIQYNVIKSINSNLVQHEFRTGHVAFAHISSATDAASTAAAEAANPRRPPIAPSVGAGAEALGVPPAADARVRELHRQGKHQVAKQMQG